jgi:hypothetical protein
VSPFALGLLEKRGEIAILIYIIFVIFSVLIYIYCGGEVTTTRSQWQKGNLSFLGFVKGKT